jgi:lysyl-tRNA synthetase class 2
MFNAMRSFFNDRGYLEVETPVLTWWCSSTPIYHNHNRLITYCMPILTKKINCWWFEGVYEFSKNSVTKGWTEHTTQNLPLWKYIAYKDYNWMMKLPRPLEHCAVAVTERGSYFMNINKLKAPYACYND